MDFFSFYSSLSIDERIDYAQRANRSREYIDKQLITKKKKPRTSTMHAFAEASNGQLSYHDVLMSFYS
jgi:hypothetical protein